MIKFINENNAKTMDILIKKATVGKIDRCENDKLEIFDVVKQPFWMLVNTTIQAEGSTELEIMVGTIIEILSQELQNYCGNTETQRKGNEEEGPRFSDRVVDLTGAKKLRQFRFKDVLDLETGKRIFELQHEA